MNITPSYRNIIERTSKISRVAVPVATNGKKFADKSLELGNRIGSHNSHGSFCFLWYEKPPTYLVLGTEFFPYGEMDKPFVNVRSLEFFMIEENRVPYPLNIKPTPNYLEDIVGSSIFPPGIVIRNFASDKFTLGKIADYSDRINKNLKELVEDACEILSEEGSGRITLPGKFDICRLPFEDIEKTLEKDLSVKVPDKWKLYRAAFTTERGGGQRGIQYDINLATVQCIEEDLEVPDARDLLYKLRGLEKKRKDYTEKNWNTSSIVKKIDKIRSEIKELEKVANREEERQLSINEAKKILIEITS